MLPIRRASARTHARFYFAETDCLGAVADCVVQFAAQAQIVLL
jgi:hypothetical protein